jgi:hypothetical protein
VSSVNVNLSPTLGAFLSSNAFVRGVVGPIGSGKTSACVLEIIRRAQQQAPGKDGIRRSRWAVIRNTYPELRDTTRKTFEDWIPESTGTWYEQEFTFEFRAGDVYAEILFRALDKPKDVKKTLSLELTGAYINEAREIPKHIFDMLQGRVGRYPSKKDGGCTFSGVWFDTNPFPVSHWMYPLFKKELPEGFELFEQPDGLGQDAENVDNLERGYYERLQRGKDTEWINTYLRGKYPRSDVGSYYGELLTALEERGGLKEFSHGTDGVFTSWDLGIGDSTAIWFWRFQDQDGAPILELPPGPAGSMLRAPEVIDHYEAHGKPLSHYFELLERWAIERGYGYRKHWLPHDARARTLATGQSILDQCLARWGAGLVEIVERLSVEDGIQAVRWLLERPIRIHPRCSIRNDELDVDGIECLRNYRKRWNEELKVYADTPLHDHASHSADAFRMGAVAIRISEQNLRPEPPPEPEPHGVKFLHQLTLGELWDLYDEEQAYQRRWARLP